MPWRLTTDVNTYAEAAWPLLAADPAEQTVALTVIDGVRAGRWAGTRTWFGWFEDGDGVGGAVSLTPPFELLLAATPEDTLPELVAALRAAGVDVPGAGGDPDAVERFAAAWTAGTRLEPRLGMRHLLYRLGTLRPPSTTGRGRPAAAADLELAAAWWRAFEAEAAAAMGGAEAMVRERAADGRLWLWEDEAGTAVALAGRTPAVAGVARIAPVYTPPEHRRHGYGAAVTAACSEDALARGAGQVVLFADVDNPTSNAVYERIGFEPISERLVVRFT